MNYWLNRITEKEKEEEKEKLLAFWQKMALYGLPKSMPPITEEREDVENYAQGLIFKNANVIRKHGLFVRNRGLKTVDQHKKIRNLFVGENMVISQHRETELK